MFSVEIMEFYLKTRDETRQILTGSLTVFLSDFSIEVRGVFCSRKKDFWYFSMPGSKGVSRETGELVRFSFVSMRDREKQKELMAAIREKAIPFIEQYLKEHPQALTDNQPDGQIESELERAPVKARSLPRKQQQTKTMLTRSDHSPVIKTAPELKRTMQLGKIAIKEYRDLPPRVAKTSK